MNSFVQARGSQDRSDRNLHRLNAFRIMARIGLGLLALIAWTIISLEPKEVQKGPDGFQILYFFLILGAFLYLHWLLRWLLIPVSHLSSSEAQALFDRASNYYSTRHSDAATVLGYFFLFLHCLICLHPTSSSTLVVEAFLCIAAGTILQARGIIKLITIQGGKG